MNTAGRHPQPTLQLTKLLNLRPTYATNASYSDCNPSLNDDGDSGIYDKTDAISTRVLITGLLHNQALFPHQN